MVYLEPLALALSRKAKRPVKMVMSREEVFKAGADLRGHRPGEDGRDQGRQVRGRLAELLSGRRLPGLAGAARRFCAYAPYDIENVKVIGYDVVSNRPKVAAYRAPGAPISEFAVESVVDEIAKKLGLDLIELRMMNAAREGTKAAYGPKFGPIGLEETLNADQEDRALDAAPEVAGPRVASGFWFNIGGETRVSLTVNEDGTVSLMAGTPDIGGLRASLAAVAPTSWACPTTRCSRSSATRARSASPSSRAAAARPSRARWRSWRRPGQIKADLCARACKLWEAKPDQVEFSGGAVRPLGPHREGQADVDRGLRQGGRQDRRADRRLRPHQCPGRGPSFGTHLVDLEVDPETGRVTILRYTVAQDAGRPPSRPTSRDSSRAARCRASAGR